MPIINSYRTEPFAANIVPPPAPPGEFVNAANVMYTGHSLLDVPIHDYVGTIAASKGTPYQYQRQNIAGSPLQLRTGNPSNAFAGYSTGTNRGGSTNLDIRAELITPATITGKYTAAIITERHTLIDTMEYENTQQAIRHFHDRVIDGNAYAQTYLWHCWLGSIDATTLNDWIAYENSALPVWEGLTSRINLGLQQESRPQRMLNIPASQGLVKLAQRLLANTLTGFTGGTAANTVALMFSDDVHPTDMTSYYLSCIAYSFVFRKSPMGASYAGSTVNATQAASLQELAWNTALAYFATQPTSAASRAYMTSTFCSSYWTYRGLTGNIGACQTYYPLNVTDAPFSDVVNWWPATVPIVRTIGANAANSANAGVRFMSIRAGFGASVGQGYGHASMGTGDDAKTATFIGKFMDFSSLPAGKTITGVKLRLVQSEATVNVPTNVTIYAYRLLKPWKAEQESVPSPYPGTGLPSWELFDAYTGEPWTTPGARGAGTDRASTPSFSFNSVDGTAVGAVLEINDPGLTADVVDMHANPSTNYGWVFDTDPALGVGQSAYFKILNEKASANPGDGNAYEPNVANADTKRPEMEITLE